VSQRAKVAKNTAETMRMYEKCDKECDAIVDKILADMTAIPKPIDNEITSCSTTETDLTHSKKNLKSNSKSAIEPKVVESQKKKTT